MADEKKEEGLNLNINLDTTPVLYTDNILMSVNDDGVVLDIVQRVGISNQARVVSRLGMSKSHAKKFIKAFLGVNPRETRSLKIDLLPTLRLYRVSER